MPEGHTLHLLARDHRRRFGGGRVRVSSPQGRATEAAARVDGSVLVDVEANGKHLFYEFSTGDVLHVHLGLFGKFHEGPTSGPNVRWRMTDETGGSCVDLTGPTARPVSPRPPVLAPDS